MRKLSLALLGVALIAAFPGTAPATDQRQVAERPHRRPDLSSIEPRWVPGEVLVQFERGLAPVERARTLAALGARTTRRIPYFGIDVVRLADGVGVTEALAELSANPLVAHAEPNFLLNPVEVIPDDTHFESLWGLRNVGQDYPVSDPPPGAARGTNDADIDASDAWDTQQGSPETVIAVVDSGVDTLHPDLDANIWTNPGEVPANGLDDDANGFVDDVNGWDFAEDDNTVLQAPPFDGYEHGTHVAGIIAAEIHNTEGIAGVCPRCQIMPLKIMEPVDTDQDGTLDAMSAGIAAELDALAYAIRMGADVVNGSYGSSFVWSRFEHDAFVELGEAGIIAVMAAGNENGDNDLFVDFLPERDGVFSASPAYPAAYNVPSILAVAASNSVDAYGTFTGCTIARGDPAWPCAFSNWGHDSVDLAAPGVDIVSTVPGGYANFNGTSMAAPHVAGVAGLVKSQHPEYTGEQVKNAILNSVDRPANLGVLNAFPGVQDRGAFSRTSGRVNAAAALNGSTSPATLVTDGNIDGAKSFRSSASGSIAWPDDANDVLKKRLRKGVVYKVVFSGPAGQPIDLWVWKPGTIDIWQFENGCFATGPCKVVGSLIGDGKRVGRFKARKTGTYFFQVNAFFSRGNYSLKVTKL